MDTLLHGINDVIGGDRSVIIMTSMVDQSLAESEFSKGILNKIIKVAESDLPIKK